MIRHSHLFLFRLFLIVGGSGEDEEKEKERERGNKMAKRGRRWEILECAASMLTTRQPTVLLIFVVCGGLIFELLRIMFGY